jgi:hypothetical protein
MAWLEFTDRKTGKRVSVNGDHVRAVQDVHEPEMSNEQAVHFTRIITGNSGLNQVEVAMTYDEVMKVIGVTPAKGNGK